MISALRLCGALSLFVLMLESASPSAQGPPSNLAAAVDRSTVTLSWEGVAPNWQIEAGPSPGTTTFIAHTGNPATALTVANVLPGSYFVRVRPFSSGLPGPPSNEVHVTVILLPPGPPTALSGAVVGSVVSLSWATPQSGGAPTAYVIEGGAGPGLSDLAVIPVRASAMTLRVSAVPPGFYYVRAKAANQAGSSAASNEILLAVGASSSTIQRDRGAGVDCRHSGRQREHESGRALGHLQHHRRDASGRRPRSRDRIESYVTGLTFRQLMQRAQWSADGREVLVVIAYVSPVAYQATLYRWSTDTGQVGIVVPNTTQFPFGITHMGAASRDLGYALVDPYRYNRAAMLNTATGIGDFVDTGLNGADPNGISYAGDLSPSGRFATFSSSASNLIEQDFNDRVDSFLFDTQARTVARVSRGLDGTEPDEVSDAGVVSDDGRFVAYSSTATNLTPGDLNGTRDIFLHDRITGETLLVSRTLVGISDDGRHALVRSSASNLIPGDDNAREDLFLIDVPSIVTR